MSVIFANNFAFMPDLLPFFFCILTIKKNSESCFVVSYRTQSWVIIHYSLIYKYLAQHYLFYNCQNFLWCKSSEISGKSSHNFRNSSKF
jgi:hypothetical protein